MSASIQGLDKLLAQLNGYTQAMVRGAETASSETAEAIASEARDLAPVDTGALRASITVVKDGKTFSVGSDLRYAPDVELGTRNTQAHPFLYPAFLLHRDQFLASLKAQLPAY